MDLPAEQISESRWRPAIRHVNHVHAAHQLEELAGHMGRRPDASRGHVELARVGLGIVDELRNGIGRERCIDFHHVGYAGDGRNRRDVARKIVVEFSVERDVDRMRGRDHEQRVAVRRRIHDCLGGDIAAGAGAVLDDELLAEPLRQALTHEPRQDVGDTAGRIADDQFHGPRGISPSRCDTRKNRERGSARGQIQKSTAANFHRVLLGRVRIGR